MTARAEQGVRIVMARTDQLVLHPKNVRKEYGDLRELAESIAVHGVLEPLIVEDMIGKGRVLAGHRRLLAARQARVPRVPCVLRDPVPDDQAIALMVTENKHRLGLTRDEKTAAAQALLGNYGWSQAAIARGFGVSQATVSRWIAGRDDADTEPTRDDLIGKAKQRAANRTAGAPQPVTSRPPGQHRAAPTRNASTVTVKNLVRDVVTRWEGSAPAGLLEELRGVIGDPS